MQKYVEYYDMQINTKKTTIFPVNFTRKYDFLPKLKFDNKELEVVYTAKILGVIFSSDGEWEEHIKYVTGKANSRLYFLRRLKKLGAGQSTLKEVYNLFIRSILEMCAPLWAGNLKKCSLNSLIRVERNAMKIIFPQKDYLDSIDSLQMKPIQSRLFILTKKCALKMSENKKFKSYFKQKKGTKTRSRQQYHVPKYRRNRHKYSSIPIFLRMLNEDTINLFRN